MTIWRMRIACRIPKATNAQSEYVTLTACPLKEWLHERASGLRYRHIAFLVLLFLNIHTHNSHSLKPCAAANYKRTKPLTHNTLLL